MGTCARAEMFQPARLGGIEVAICMELLVEFSARRLGKHGRDQDGAGISGTRLGDSSTCARRWHVGKDDIALERTTHNGEGVGPLIMDSKGNKRGESNADEG